MSSATTPTRPDPYATLRRACRYASRKYRELRNTEDYRYCHESFAMRDALQLTEVRFPELRTYGVESGQLQSGEYFSYLNTGDTYNPTIVHFRGRFSVCAWGDIVERYDR
jgi:hypothetical protein